jgi:hypothetical protein
MTNIILVVMVVTEQQGSCGQEMFATYCLQHFDNIEQAKAVDKNKVIF